MLKTETVGIDEDNPTHSICRGHVDLETFNKAFTAEGWGADDWHEVEHQYWVNKNDAWYRTDKGAQGSEPVTVGEW